MPITQSRMIAVLDAAAEYERNHEHVRHLIALFREEYGAVTRARTLIREAGVTRENPAAPGIDAYETAIAEIFDVLDKELHVSLDAMKVIVAERAHFLATSRTNAQSAAAMRRLRSARRGYADPPPRPNGPRPARYAITDAEHAEYEASVAFVARIDAIRLANGGASFTWEQGVAVAERQDAIAALRAADPKLTDESAAKILNREAAARERDRLPPGESVF